MNLRSKKGNIDHKTGLKQVPGARNLMIFGPIARFRRLESRFSGQNGPRSSEMRFYIEITGYIKNLENFKNLFWSRDSKKQIFMIFPEHEMPGAGCRMPEHEMPGAGCPATTW